MKRFSVPRLLCVLAAISCTCAALTFAVQVAPTPAKASSATPASPDTSGLIILDIATPEKGELPPVVFDHNKHTQGENPAATCETCHSGHSLRLAEGKKGKDLENAFHDSCISCHAEVKSRGKASPPQKAECRSCHNANALPLAKAPKNKPGDKPMNLPGGRVDGGFDASLHARHVASAKIENCASCHHQTKVPLSSPSLKVDSCRSCHAASPGDAVVPGSTGAPPFAQAAHTSCISCHMNVAKSGTPVPLTCDSCHSLAKKAGYAKLDPVPRLKAGQPDMIVMGASASTANTRSGDLPVVSPGQSLPDKKLADTTAPQTSMPPVAFNHKNHETTVDSCISCHHNTLQKCSSCHTPTGSAKGGNVTLALSMHAIDSNRSCMGCHESRKTAKPECAGCHAIMPRAKTAQSNCQSCHTPANVSGAKQLYPPRMPVIHGPGPALPPGALPVAGPPAVAPPPPPGTLEREALAKAPESISIGILANEFEPSVFPHKRVVESLIAGLEVTSPGMMTFHSEPYSLCASCHHNSRPTATPASCATCHSKATPKTPDGGTPLRTAYHQQCMSCHTAMNIKPAATDCAGCHAKRVTPGKGGR
ncbi:MAG: High-molecular-weight cytochrome c [Desulfovibrio sp.]